MSNVEHRNRRIAFAVMFAFQCLLLLFVLLVCNIKYEVSDDYVMEMIVSGTYTGVPDARMMYSNVIWGGMLTLFYRVYGDISWYLIFQMGICFLSYVMLSGLLIDRVGALPGSLISALLTVFTAGDLYVLPQYTKTAAAVIVIGSLAYLDGIFSEKQQHGKMICGGLLALAGTLIRFQTLFLAVLTVGTVLLLGFAGCIRKHRPWKRVFGHIILPGLGLVCVILGCRLIDQAAYALDDDYAYWSDYNRVRTTIVDYTRVPYEDCAGELEAIGLTENDYYLIQHWNFGDPEKYDLETMTKVAEIMEAHRQNSLPSLREMYHFIRERKFFSYPLTWCCILIGLLCAAADWRRLWLPVLAAGMCLFYAVYFYATGRYVYRVEFGYLYAAALLISYGMPQIVRERQKRLCSAAAGLCVVFAAVYNIHLWIPDKNITADEARQSVWDIFYHSADYDARKYGSYIPYGELYPDLVSQAEEHPDTVYLMEFQTTIQTFYYQFNPFQSASAVFPKNMVWIGGVTVNHPSVTGYFADEGYENFLQDLTMENVYYVGNRFPDRMEQYLVENGHSDAGDYLADEVDGFQIWKFSE